MDIDISSILIKNKALEVTTKLILNDKKDSLEKAFFEIKYATVITIDENLNDKNIIGKRFFVIYKRLFIQKLKKYFWI